MAGFAKKGGWFRLVPPFSMYWHESGLLWQA